MYRKFGRVGGGGRSGAKRKSLPPPTPHRPPSSSSRLSLSSRKPSSTPPPPPPPPPSHSDETYSLVSGDPPAFASIIRLAPYLVDEIKRVESHGGDVRIKFDSNPNNSSANVIDVGGKEFRFTWSQEMSGLCDIYEECQSAVDGNGLLVESGCLRRKLNVQRVLDEFTKKQVKKRSEEYEQKQKSRKAIVLNQCNPSMKRQMEAIAAVEVSPCKFKPQNKRYLEPPHAGGHPKAIKPTSGFSAPTMAKVKQSYSPRPSSQNQPVSLASAFGRGNAVETQNVLENATTKQGGAKENVVGSENDYPAQDSSRMLKASIHKDNQGAGISDLKNLLVTLLKGNAQGMSLKALEKAVGDTTSNSARKIEPILRKIATFEPPGRYILKSGIELESLKKSYSDSGRSPEDNHGVNQKQFVLEDNHGEVPVPDTGYAGKSLAEDLVEDVQNIDESNMVENFDASQHFSVLFGDDEPPEHREGRAAKSNDSDSGDNDSASRSRSRSPAGSGSARSSDSEGEVFSTNSKEASDVDVDIICDDSKEPKNLQGTEHGLSASQSLHSDRRPSAGFYSIETIDKGVKNPPNFGVDSISLETNTCTQEDFLKSEDKCNRDAQVKEDSSYERDCGKFKESPLVQRHLLRPESLYRKDDEWEKKLCSGASLRPLLKDSDRSPDKRRLKQDLSDLELPLPESEGTKRKQFSRVGSFKTKLGNSASWNAELKGEPTSKPIMDLGPSFPQIAGGTRNNFDSSLSRSLEAYIEDGSCPLGALNPQFQQSRNGHAEVGSLPNKTVDCGRLVQNETICNQGTYVEGYGETQKRSHITSKCEELRQTIGSHKGKGNKSRKSNGSKDASDRRRDGSNVQGRKEKRKRSESFPDENIFFSKYEKQRPELKKSIKSLSQYKDYVQEYHEKYESYCSLHKNLETYKNEFQKLGMDLDNAKGRDEERYYDILAQLRESYNLFGMRHKQLKKIFIVLHEELKHLKQMIKDFAAC